MVGRTPSGVTLKVALASLSIGLMSAAGAHAQYYGPSYGQVPQIAQTPQSYARPGMPLPGGAGPYPYGGAPSYSTEPAPIAPSTPAPGQPGEPAPSGGPSPTTPGAATPAPPEPSTPAATGAEAGTGLGASMAESMLGMDGSAYQPSGGFEQFAAQGGQTFNVADNVGYIDSAIIRSRFRLRYDGAYGLDRPDRAEFFYAKCGCFNSLTTLALSPTAFDPKARGPKHMVPKVLTPGGRQIWSPFEVNVDYQDVTPYLEFAPRANFSVFAELPARFLNPTLNANANGWSDMNMGFKYAFIANPNQFYTFQFRTYVPTGDADRGLGTGHPTLEPGLLFFQRLSDRWYLAGQFRDWIPVRGSNYAGNILIYGLGLTYNIILTNTFRVAPVNEVVGWTILNGMQSNPGWPFPANAVPGAPSPAPNAGPAPAGGGTIINYKIGLRFGLGNYNLSGGGSGVNDRHSLYLGYGRSLTSEHWYDNMFRLEYNYWF